MPAHERVHAVVPDPAAHVGQQVEAQRDPAHGGERLGQRPEDLSVGPAVGTQRDPRFVGIRVRRYPRAEPCDDPVRQGLARSPRLVVAADVPRQVGRLGGQGLRERPPGHGTVRGGEVGQRRQQRRRPEPDHRAGARGHPGELRLGHRLNRCRVVAQQPLEHQPGLGREPHHEPAGAKAIRSQRDRREQLVGHGRARRQPELPVGQRQICQRGVRTDPAQVGECVLARVRRGQPELQVGVAARAGRRVRPDQIEGEVGTPAARVRHRAARRSQEEGTAAVGVVDAERALLDGAGEVGVPGEKHVGLLVVTDVRNARAAARAAQRHTVAL